MGPQVFLTPHVVPATVGTILVPRQVVSCPLNHCRSHLSRRLALSNRAQFHKVAPPKTLSIAGSGASVFWPKQERCLDAAARGEIPFFQVGRLKRVSVARMEQLMLEGANAAPRPPPIETPVKAVKAPIKKPATPSKYPRSTAVRRRAPALLDAS